MIPGQPRTAEKGPQLPPLRERDCAYVAGRSDSFTKLSDLELQLQDSGAEILLIPFPTTTRQRQIDTVVRHSLKPWGSMYIYRPSNTASLIKANDPIYKEVAKVATSVALTASKLLCRRRSAYSANLDPSLPIHLENWRVLNASRHMFDGLDIEENEVDRIADRIGTDGFGH